MIKLIYSCLLISIYAIVIAGNAEITNIDLPSKINQGKHWIEGTIKNNGTSPIVSMTVNWTIDQGVSRADTLTGLNIAVGANYAWTSSLGWGAETNGSFDLKAWISEVNGTIGEIDELQKTIVVFKAVRMPLVEVITSANCGPCAATVPSLMQRIMNTKSYGLAIAWHGGPGAYAGDDMYQDNTSMYSRMSYYNGNAYPTSTINGDINAYDYPTTIDETVIYNKSIVATDFSIENVTFQIDSGMANFYADITSPKAPSTYIPAYRVQVVLVEKFVKFVTPPGTNGEKEFPNVAKAMFGGTTGSKLQDVLTAGNISGSFDLSTLHIYNEEELAVIIFIQSNSLSQTNGMKEVFQAAFADQRGEPDVTVPEELVEPNGIATTKEKFSVIYPNPAADKIVIEMKVNGEVEYSISNIAGKQLIHSKLGNVKSGNQIFISADELQEGIYFINLKSGEMSSSQKVVISR